MFAPIEEIFKEGRTGKKVRVRGWIYRTRSSGGIAFIVVRDSSGIVQVTVKKGNLPEEQFNDARKALIESSVEIEGEIAEDRRAPGGIEIRASRFNVISFAEPFPITENQSEELLMDYRHLWIRSREMAAMLKVRSTVFGAVDEFFRSRGYYEFQAPSLTGSNCEGGSTQFEVKYFDRKAYLTQSWQLYAEAAIFSLEKIYDIAPSFRAEPSKTSRHLTEYWHAEMEVAWAHLDDVLKEAEDLISFICKSVAEKNAPELEIFGTNPEELMKITPPFPRVKYDDALKMLKEAGMDVPYGKDLRTLEEEKLSKMFDKPVFVTHYPEEIMAFYKPTDPDDPGKSLCFDLLATNGYGEIIGGSERETSIEVLKEKLIRDGEDPANYEWYMDLRRYGSVPHSGFGMGVERVVRWILGLDHIKDAIGFPRLRNRIYP